MKNINKNSLYKIFDWFAFICLFGLSVYLMENVLQEYTKRETSLLISEESLHELPTVTLCFQSILGKIEPAFHISQSSKSSYIFCTFSSRIKNKTKKTFSSKYFVEHSMIADR